MELHAADVSALHGGGEVFDTSIEVPVTILGDDGPGVRRMRETRDFFAFFEQDLAGLTERWRAYRKSQVGS